MLKLMMMMMMKVYDVGESYIKCAYHLVNVHSKYDGGIVFN